MDSYTLEVQLQNLLAMGCARVSEDGVTVCIDGSWRDAKGENVVAAWEEVMARWKARADS